MFAFCTVCEDLDLPLPCTHGLSSFFFPLLFTHAQNTRQLTEPFLYSRLTRTHAHTHKKKKKERKTDDVIVLPFLLFCYCVADNAGVFFFFCRSTLYFLLLLFIHMCMCTCICLVLSYLLLLLVRYTVVAYLALTVEARPCPPTWRSFTKQTLVTGSKKKKKVNGKKQQQQTTKKLSFFTCIIQPIPEGFLLANEYSHCGSCPCYRILSVPLRSTYLNCNYGFKTSPTCCGLPSVAGATQHRKADPCFFFFLTLLVLTPIHAFRSL